MRHFRRLLFPALIAAASASPAAAPAIPDALLGRIVHLNKGRLAPTRMAVNTRYVAFYFGAGWCGPCRAFMPELKRGYARLREAGTPVEIVFVSDDASCRAMADYITAARMPWPALGCRDRERFGWLQRARGAALPGMLIYDANGSLLSSSWSRAGYSRPREALARLERLASGR